MARGTSFFRPLLGATFVVGAHLISACSEPLEPASNRPTQLLGEIAEARTSDARRLRTFDDEMVEMARSAPGFTGFYVDENGQLRARSTNRSNRSQIATQLHEFLRSTNQGENTARSALIAAMLIEHADYDFVQLSTWYRELTPLFGSSGITVTDIDERRNRVVIGVRNATSIAAIRDKLRNFAVPAEAVLIEVRPLIEMESGALQLKVRPVTAGTRVITSEGCTIGFPTYYQTPGVGDPYYLYDGLKYFVTAAHCTTVFGVLNYNRFGQPDQNNPVGTEIADPSLFTSAENTQCPAEYPCRYSDAALVRLDGTIDWRVGKIPAVASTEPPYYYTNYNTFYNTDGFVDSSFGDLYNGTGIVVTGQAGGRTHGQITDTCVGVPQSDDGLVIDRWLLCQFLTNNLNSTGGDSGGPVSTLGATPTLLGVHWGKSRLGAGLLRGAFSPFYFVSMEIGAAMGGGQLSAGACHTPGCRPY